MGRAIVREPLVFLFDEPLSNLDAKLRVQMRLEIKRLHAELRTTSVYVTHDQVEAMTLADRLIVMNAGRAEQIGTPLDIYHEPATVFVAGFIGSPAMNMIPVRKEQAGGALELPGGGRLDFGPRLAGHAGVTLGLRPEHLEVVPADQALFDVSVELVEALGADTLVHGRIGGSGPVVTVRLPGASRVAAGGMLPVAVAAENIHVFDAETGRRL
jgi:sn-glycerol 3-phosphate transport system ATP-binding protein